MEDKKKIEVSKEELAKAVTIYVAGESGLTEEVSPEEAGRRGAFISELTEVGKRYVNGEISQEQVEQEIIEKTTTYALSPIVDKVLDKGIDIISELIGKQFPKVEEVLKASKSIIKSFVKSKVLNKAKEVVNKAWVKAKAWIKSKF